MVITERLWSRSLYVLGEEYVNLVSSGGGVVGRVFALYKRSLGASASADLKSDARRINRNVRDIKGSPGKIKDLHYRAELQFELSLRKHFSRRGSSSLLIT